MRPLETTTPAKDRLQALIGDVLNGGSVTEDMVEEISKLDFTKEHHDRVAALKAKLIDRDAVEARVLGVKAAVERKAAELAVLKFELRSLSERAAEEETTMNRQLSEHDEAEQELRGLGELPAGI